MSNPRDVEEALRPAAVVELDRDNVDAEPEAEDRMQAHFLAEELTRIGIPAVADSHEPNELLGGLDALPKIWVRAEDYDKARSWLGGYEMTLREGHPARDE